MKLLPERPHFDHLKKQAKELLRAWQQREPEALQRLAESLPALRDKKPDELPALPLKLHDMQSCVAREYGFVSWHELRLYVEERNAMADTQQQEKLRKWRWLRLVYGSEVAGGGGERARPRLAARLLAERLQSKHKNESELAESSLLFACATGNVERLQRELEKGTDWINQNIESLNITPLCAAVFSSLLQVSDYRPRLVAAIKLLLDHGADPNIRFGTRWTPASLREPGEALLSCLYAACSVNADEEVAALLLAAGANPDDGESLSHCVESPARVNTLRRLLQAGATIGGSSALFYAINAHNQVALQILLDAGADANERSSSGEIALLRAIEQRCALALIELLLQRGADPRAVATDGNTAYQLAATLGLSAVVARLEQLGIKQELSVQQQFLQRCTSVDDKGARDLLRQHPGLISTLSPAQLQLLATLAADARNNAAVKLMVTLGWPVYPADAHAYLSALNQAVFRGDVGLTGFLLAHGASWRERQSFGSNVAGTLSWASCNLDNGSIVEAWQQEAENADWAGCAAVLIEYGFPTPKPQQGGLPRRPQIDPGGIWFDFEGELGYLCFSDAVTELMFDAWQRQQPAAVA